MIWYNEKNVEQQYGGEGKSGYEEKEKIEETQAERLRCGAADCFVSGDRHRCGAGADAALAQGRVCSGLSD